jgi:hypothetical protein
LPDVFASGVVFVPKYTSQIKEFAEQATTIRKKLGGGTYGTFFGGA